jgi:hypothetical protein
VHLRPRSEAVEKRKVFLLLRFEPRSPISYAVSIRKENSRLIRQFVHGRAVLLSARIASEQRRLKGCDALQPGTHLLKFKRNVLPPSSGFRSVPRKLSIHPYWWMVSSGMLRRVAIVRTDVSEESSASFIRVTRIGELGTTVAATSNRRTLRRNAKWQPKRHNSS